MSPISRRIRDFGCDLCIGGGGARVAWGNVVFLVDAIYSVLETIVRREMRKGEELTVRPPETMNARKGRPLMPWLKW